VVCQYPPRDTCLRPTRRPAAPRWRSRRGSAGNRVSFVAVLRRRLAKRLEKSAAPRPSSLAASVRSGPAAMAGPAAAGSFLRAGPSGGGPRRRTEGTPCARRSGRTRTDRRCRSAPVASVGRSSAARGWDTPDAYARRPADRGRGTARRSSGPGQAARGDGRWSNLDEANDDAAPGVGPRGPMSGPRSIGAGTGPPRGMHPAEDLRRLRISRPDSGSIRRSRGALGPRYYPFRRCSVSPGRQDAEIHFSRQPACHPFRRGCEGRQPDACTSFRAPVRAA